MLNNLLWYLVIIILSLIEWYIFRYILNKISIIKKNKLTLNILFVINILITILLNFLDVEPNIKVTIALCLGFIFYSLSYEVSILKNVVTCLIYWMINLGFDALGVGIVITINSMNNLNELLKNNIFRLEVIAISKLLLILLIPLAKLLNINLIVKRKEYIYICIPIIANILSIIIIFSYIFRKGENNIIILIISILLSNISLISIIFKFIKDNKIKLENDIIKEKMELHYKYHIRLEDKQKKLMRLSHDMIHHMICIENMIENKYDIRSYINNINSEIKSCELDFKTGNMFLDIILAQKKDICDKTNIVFKADINFLKCKFIDEIDVCSIFSNIFDNAIEACDKIDDKKMNKFINAKGIIVKEFFVLKVENSKINNITIKNNKIITDKKDSRLHGIGINSIKDLVKKYDGEVVIAYIKDKFIISIYIPLQE